MGNDNRKRRWLKRAALVGLVVAVCWLGSRRPELPGSLGVVAVRVKTGMSRDEIVELIRPHRPSATNDGIARLYVHGRTRDGKGFVNYCDWDFNKLPPVEQLEWAVLDLDDDYDSDLLITLGPGGVVTGVRLKSDSPWDDCRYILARGTGWSGWRSLPPIKSDL